ncbi:MAG: PadR family transcriptional regulator [Chloroflexota bacterium]|nr:MAG: PadR family transcriptional regulator [Chloroflexota bacterium]
MTKSWFWERARGKFFERGDMKYMILSLLQDKPKHGYEIIKDLEQQFGGFYSPSPGSIYPTLQMLEDQGYVTSMSQDGKRVYSITDEGRAFLSQREDVFEDVRVKWERDWAPRVRHEARNLAREFRDLGQTVFQGTRNVRTEPDRLARIRDVLARAQREIFDILGEEPKKKQEPAQTAEHESQPSSEQEPRHGFEQ